MNQAIQRLREDPRIEMAVPNKSITLEEPIKEPPAF